MRFSHSFVLFTLLAAPLCALATSDVSIADIKNAAAEDNIDLSAFPDLDVALESIEATYASHAARKRDPTTAKCRQRDISSASTIIDVHTHVVPDWYKVLVPTTGGNPTPQWNVSSYLAFMDTQGISHSIFAFSAPGSNVYFGQREITVALARLINEQSAAYARLYPRRFSFYAVVPLPYTAEAIKEANYALDKLGAAGVVLTSNHEGMYLGHASFRPFFEAMNKRGKTILYVHPAAPYMKVDNKFVEANPTPYPTGNIEFYFETARTLMDLTLTQTIHNFTNLHYVIPHVGGAAPAVFDRLLKTVPAIYDSSLKIYQTRFWWDSAGPTYYHQVNGLLAYGIPKSQLLFGTDFPYAPGFTQAASLAAVKNAPILTAVERTALFSDNAKRLFAGKIKF